MVFRHEGNKVTIAGKPIKKSEPEDSNHYGKHIKLTAKQIELRANTMNSIEAVNDMDMAPAEHPDPFARHAAIAEMPIYERQRIVHDQGGFVDKWLGEMSVIASDIGWLDNQLSDPRWADHPGRADALKQRAVYEEHLRDIADSIAWAEAWADRCWQTLTVEEREPVCHLWLTDPETPRLIGRSWKDQAQFGWKWPQGFRVEAKWFVGLPTELYTQLTPLWMQEPTWLGEPVEIEIDEEKQRQERAEAVHRLWGWVS